MSRTQNEPGEERSGPNFGYLRLSRMMREGRSWSGRERNCAFLNTADGRFADVSATSGLDLLDDARAIALSDWDHDGDLDVWVTNRNAPRLRLLLSTASRTGGAVSILLRGDGRGTSRDAIGARVELRGPQASDRASVRTLRAGEGFLAQSTKWLVFGVADAEGPFTATVSWPGGERESFEGLTASRRWLLVQGAGEAREAPSRPAPSALRPGPLEPAEPSRRARVRALYDLPFPSETWRTFADEPRPLATAAGKRRLLVLWASWCAPCLAELGELGRRHAELAARAIEPLALAVDGVGEDRTPIEEARSTAARLALPFSVGRATEGLLATAQRVHDALVPIHRPLPVPTSLLLDEDGHIVALYKGHVAVDEVLADAALGRRALRQRWVDAALLPGSALDHPAALAGLRRTELQARFQLGLELSEAGRFTDALAQYRQLVELAPEFVEARNNLGIVLSRLGRWDAAEAEFRAALAERPDSAPTRFNLGTVHDHRGEVARAVAAYREALRIDPRQPGAHGALGLLFARQGDLQSALIAFRREVENSPRDAEAANHLGLALLQTGAVDEAIASLERAVRLRPGLADAHNNLGVALRRAERLEDAVAHYRAAVAAAPGFAEAWNNLGAALLHLGRLDEAEAACSKALELRPDYPAARDNLQRVRAARRP